MPYLTSQAMYIQRNIESHLRNHCCRGRAMSIHVFCVCVRACVRAPVALGIQHEKRLRHNGTYGLSNITIFFHTVQHEMHVLILCTTFV